VGLEPVVPRGAYYTLADCTPFGMDDAKFAERLVAELGVACVPGSSFFSREPDPGLRGHAPRYVRFTFCKTMDTLDAAAERLAGLEAWR